MDQLKSRLNEAEENSIDRRKWSDGSKRHLAEAFHHQDWEEVTLIFWDLMTTDENIGDWEPWRDVEGTVTIAAEIADQHPEKTIVVEVSTKSGETGRAYLRGETESTYTLGELLDGTYDLSAAVVGVRSGIEDETEYVVDSYELQLEEKSIMIDTESTEIGASVVGPTVTVTSIEISEATTEGDN